MVEWKKLGEITNRNKGIPITAGQMSELASADGNVRVFAAGSTIADIDEKLLPKNCAYRLPSIIVKSRGYVDFEFYEKPFTHKNEMWSYSFENKKQGKYIFYYLTTKTEFFRKKAKANSVKLPQLCVADTDSYLIPIPSLSEQIHIVDILDTFTASIENLKLQIVERRKQYEYYRDQLLDLEGKEGVEMKMLGELSKKISSGKNKSKNREGLYPVFGSTGIIAYCDRFVFDKPLILVARVGANAGFVHLSHGKYDVTDNTLFIELLEGISQKYIYYNLVKEKVNRYAKGGGQPLITSSVLKEIIIPVPSLEEQSRIVSILDTFEASIANLEAQLELREKQYEYYRNKLLTFE